MINNNGNKIKINLDTNIVQCFYLIAVVENGKQKVVDSYPNHYKAIFHLYNNKDKFKFYITSQVFNELEESTYKLPRILNYAQQICTIRTETDKSKMQNFIDSVNILAKEYTERNIFLRDSTRRAQSAIFKKDNDDYDIADALIVAESNHTMGIPTVTLNEQHLIFMTEAQNPEIPYRQIYILKKNKDFLTNNIIDKRYKQNLKSKFATTARIDDILELE